MINIEEHIKKITEIKEVIASERDKLRKLVDELTDLLDSVDDGMQSLEYALDAFSEFL